MTVDSRFQEMFAEMQQLRNANRQSGLSGGDGGGNSGSMEERVAKLETHVEYVRRDLDTIRASQDRILDKLNLLPTRNDLNTWRWQWIATAVAIIALTVGGITGGLALISSAN